MNLMFTPPPPIKVKQKKEKYNFSLSQLSVLTCLSAPVTIVSRFLSSHFKKGLNSSLTTPADISSACFVFVHSSREVSINLQKEPIPVFITIFTLRHLIICQSSF